MTIAVLGATGKTGRHLVARLCREGRAVVAIGRSAERLAALDSRAERRVAAMEDAGALAAALADARRVVNAAEARFTDAVLAALPRPVERVVLTGTMRRFLPVPDEPGRWAAHAERALAASGRAGVVVHFGMIYGPADDGNIERLLALFRRWPRLAPVVAPLADGGRRTVRPVFMDDAVTALVAALDRPAAPGPPIVVAGPPIAYAEVVRLAALACGRHAIVVPIPTSALVLAARALALAGVALPFTVGELRRTGLDKRQDPEDALGRLGVVPRPFAEGLAAKLARAS